MAGQTLADLIKVCPNCQTSVLASKYTRRDALQDDRTIVRSITSTLSPKLQKADPDLVYKSYKQLIRKLIRSFKYPTFLEATFEYTQCGVLHMHGYIVARKHAYAHIIVLLKRFGYVKSDPIFDLDGWIEYMYKDQDQESYPCLAYSA